MPGSTETDNLENSENAKERTDNPEGNSQSSENSTSKQIPPLQLGQDAATNNANLQLQHFFYHVALRAEKVTPLDEDTVLKKYYDENLISFSGDMDWDEFIRSITNQQDLDQDTVASSSASPDTQQQEQQQQFIRQAQRAMDSTARALGHSDPSLYTSQKREPSVEKLQARGLKKLNLKVDSDSNKITMPKGGAKATFKLYLQNRSKITMTNPGARPTYTIKRKNKEAMVKELLENIANGKIDRNLVIVIDNQKYDCNNKEGIERLATKFQKSNSVNKLCNRVQNLPPVDTEKSVSDSRLVVEKKYAAAPPMILALQGLDKDTTKLNGQLDPLNQNGQQRCQELQKRLKAYDEMCKKNPDARNQLTTEEQAKVSKLRAVLLLKAPLIGNDAGSKRRCNLANELNEGESIAKNNAEYGIKHPAPHEQYLAKQAFFDGSDNRLDKRYQELYSLYNCRAIDTAPTEKDFYRQADIDSVYDGKANKKYREANNNTWFTASQEAYKNDGMEAYKKDGKDASRLSKTGMVNLAKRLDISAVTPKTEALAVIGAQLQLIRTDSPDRRKLESLQTFMQKPEQYYQLCLAMAVTDNKKRSLPSFPSTSPLNQYKKALDARIEEKGKEIAEQEIAEQEIEEQEIEELTTADTTERQELAALKIAKNKAEYAINHPAPPEDAFKSTVEQAEDIVAKIGQLQNKIANSKGQLQKTTSPSMHKATQIAKQIDKLEQRQTKLENQLADLVEINQLEQPEDAGPFSGLGLDEKIQGIVQDVLTSRTVEPVAATEEATYADGVTDRPPPRLPSSPLQPASRDSSTNRLDIDGAKTATTAAGERLSEEARHPKEQGAGPPQDYVNPAPSSTPSGT